MVSPGLIEDFQDNPEHFLKYMDVDKDTNTKEFVEKFYDAFGQDQGIYLTNQVKDKPHKTMNILYKHLTGKNMWTKGTGDKVREIEDSKREITATA